uniref:N-acetyltransferase domain-containing protein n=1 Tax=Rhabditophanes sp. KR3021 TaxID=114890 RepID=A0AC35TZ34_9BILA
MAAPDFDILVNPKDPKYYEKFYTRAYYEMHGFRSTNDYSVWTTSFGNDYFYLAAIDKETGEHLGNVAGVFYRNNEGKRVLFAIGSFFLFSEFRGKGQGKQLFETLLEIGKKEGVNMYLNCGPHISDKYISIGFDKVREDRIICYRPLYSLFNFDNAVINEEINLIDIKDFTDWEKLKEYDQKIIGDIDRLSYFKTRFLEPQSHGLIAFDTATNKIIGLANAYEIFGDNLVFGPFYADDDSIAEQLLISIFKKCADSKIKINQIQFATFESNKGILNLLKKYTDGKVEQYFYRTSHFTKFDIGVKNEFIYSVFEISISFA